MMLAIKWILSTIDNIISQHPNGIVRRYFQEIDERFRQFFNQLHQLNVHRN